MAIRLLTSVSLAIRDFRHESVLSLCSVLGVAVVLAPLMILQMLKSSFIEQLLEDLRQEPSTLEIRPVGQGAYDAAWFEELANLQGVGFMIPNTRFLASAVGIRSTDGGSRRVLEASLVPTAEGDPLVADVSDAVLAAGGAWISWSVSQKLSLGASDDIQLVVGRTNDGGGSERQRLILSVGGVLDRSLQEREAVFVHLDLLKQIERYREGFADDLDWSASGQTASNSTMASFRLFAENLEDVAPLQEWLLTRNVDVRTEASQIKRVFLLDQRLSVLFVILLVLGFVGAGVTLAIILFAGVLRKRRQLCVLRLVGFSTFGVAMFPVTQGILIGLLGVTLALAILLAVGPVVTEVLLTDLQDRSQGLRWAGFDNLPLAPVSRMALGAIGLALLASLAPGVSAARVHPSRGLRDD